MSKLTIGKHSMAVVHRVVKRGKKANRYGVGSANRRLITLTKFLDMGALSNLTGELIWKERQYHFTKGYRVRSA